MAIDQSGYHSVARRGGSWFQCPRFRQELGNLEASSLPNVHRLLGKIVTRVNARSRRCSTGSGDKERGSESRYSWTMEYK